MKEITIYYQTDIDVPPPHSFSVKAELKPFGANELGIYLEQIFTEREEIPKEEIEAEGFSMDDDLIWEGNLSKNWLQELNKMIIATTDFPEENESRIKISETSGEMPKSPANPEVWISFTEQLVQACLEESGKEQPMELVLGRLEKNNFFEQARVIWSFANRTVEAELLSNEKVGFSEDDWLSSQNEVKTWVEREATHQDLYQLPKSKGWFWLLNGEIWIPYQKNLKGKIWNWISERVKL